MTASDESTPARASRVLIVARNLYDGAGGMEKTAANLANHLAASGRIVAVACRAADIMQSLYPLATDIQQFPGNCSPDQFTKTAQEFKPDVIVAFYATSLEIRGIAALADTGIPVVLHEGSNPQRVITTNWAERDKISVEQATDERIALMSMCTRLRFTLPDYLNSLPPALRQDGIAFPNAFKPASLENIGLHASEPRNYFINIGGLKKVKNLQAATRAFSLIADKIPDWDFHIFSAQPKDPAPKNNLDYFIREHRLEDRIKYFPPTNNIAREYGRAKIHVIASKQEGLPNCIAEASRHALPSIGFACCPGTNSMIRHEKNGLLADCGEDEIENLAAQMLRLAKNDAEREQFGQTAFDESHIYNPEVVFECWDRLIDSAYADSPTREALLHRRYPDQADAARIRCIQRDVLLSRPLPAPEPSDDLPILSIIVPIFNKEAYLDGTLQSIRDNKYPAREVILVNDASTDRSPEIAESFACENGWRIIHHPCNQGLSVARNTGLEAATGDIIQFWDADDIYHESGNCELIRIMTENGSDIATGLATRNGTVIERYARAAMDIPVTTYARTANILATASSCFKLYRRKFLSRYNLRFIPGLFMQDSEFNLRAFPLAERISATSTILGEYAFTEDSGSRSYHPARYDSALAIADLTQRFYTDWGLSSLECMRQVHVLSTVLPSFIRHATRNHTAIEQGTPPYELDFQFLGKVQTRLMTMTAGLLACTFPSPGPHLALYAIREGYFTWLCDLASRQRPADFMPDMLARSPAEQRLIRQLATKLPPARRQKAKNFAASA